MNEGWLVGRVGVSVLVGSTIASTGVYTTGSNREN